MKKIAVIISNEGDFKVLLHLCPTDFDKFHRVSRIEHTRGMEFSEIITLGNTHRMRGYDEIYFAARERIR